MAAIAVQLTQWIRKEMCVGYLDYFHNVYTICCMGICSD